MDVATLAAACLVASLSPGPASLSTLGTSLRSGPRRALWHTLGLATGEVPVSLAALAAAAWITRWPWVPSALAWLGFAWFAHLGVTLLVYPRASLREQDERIDSAPALFIRGMLVNLTNPKTLPWMLAVIQVASVPVDNLTPAVVAVFLLCTVGAELLVMSGYAALAGALRPRLDSPKVARAVDRVTGLLWLVLAGLALRVALA